MSFLPQTSGESNGTILRDPTPRDIGKLLELIQESTGGDTKLDSSMLMRDLLCVGYDRPVPKCDDPCIKFDPEVFKNPVPAARAIIAEVERETVGYLIYHYHYSPWMGFGAFVDDVFVSQNFRRKGMCCSTILLCIADHPNLGESDRNRKKNDR